MFPLRWVGGFQRTSRWEEELEVEMTSWGTVGAEGVSRVQLRCHGSIFPGEAQNPEQGSCLWQTLLETRKPLRQHLSVPRENQDLQGYGTSKT